MKPETPLPRSQEPAAGVCAEADQPTILLP